MSKYPGVYGNRKDGYYFKARTTKDPNTGKWTQVTRRGFKLAEEAAQARRELLEELRQPAPVEPDQDDSLTVSQLVASNLDEAESTAALTPKTIFDYRQYLADYIDPWIGTELAHQLTPKMVADWQVALAKGGKVKDGSGLSPRSISLARAPLARAYKQALATGEIDRNPLQGVPRPKNRKRHLARRWRTLALPFNPSQHTINASSGEPWPAALAAKPELADLPRACSPTLPGVLIRDLVDPRRNPSRCATRRVERPLPDAHQRMGESGAQPGRTRGTASRATAVGLL